MTTPDSATIKNPIADFLHKVTPKKLWWAELGVLALALGIFTGLSLYYWGFFQDDAYVILRYAERLLAGQGLTFNDNERVEGYTELLWTLLVAGGLALKLPAIAMVKYLSMGFALLSLVALWLCARLVVARPVLNAVPSLFLAANASFVLWSQGGLGTMLFIFVVLAHFYALLRYLYAPVPRQRDLGIACFFMALAILSRPEAVIYMIASALVLFLRSLRDGNRADFDMFLGVSIPALLVLYTFRLGYYGDFYPNTYYAKVSPNMMQWVHGMLQFYSGVIKVDGNFILLLLPLLFLLRYRLSLGAVWLFACIAAHTAYYLRIGTDLLPMNRLYQPVYALLYLAAADIAAEFLRRIETVAAKKTWRATQTALVIACIGYSGLLIQTSMSMDAYRGVFSSVENAHGTIGRWLQERANPGDKVAVTDVGATSYYAKNLYILDTLGLTDRTVAHAMYDMGYNPWLNYLSWQKPGYPQKEKAFNDYIKTYFLAQKPRYVVAQINIVPQEFEQMQRYVNAPPPALDNFLSSHMAQLVSKELFKDETVTRDYKVALVRPYDPYHAYFILLERFTPVPAQ